MLNNDDQLPSDICNDSVEKIMDYDDTEMLNSNNNFDFHSFNDENNRRDKNNADLIGAYQEKIDFMNNDKIMIQSHLNNKIIELQTQVVKMQNALEKSEMSKAEIEVEVTKVNKELRNNQREYTLKMNEFIKFKIELTNNFKSLECDYTAQIAHLTKLNSSLQEQISDGKQSNQNFQESFSDQINQLSSKIKEKDNELSRYKDLQQELENCVKKYKSNITDLTSKVSELEENSSRNLSVILEKDEQLEALKLSENKLKNLIVDLNSKINQLESQHFEEKQELNDSRSYQNNLQAQLLEFQQGKIVHDKEQKLMLEKVSSSSRRIKELEASFNNQVNIAANYREQIQKLEDERENQENNINDINEELQIKVEELESKLQVQDRMIEDVNDEISSSREAESMAVSHLTRTLEELERYISESSMNYKPVNKSPQFNKRNVEAPIVQCPSSFKNARTHITEDAMAHTVDNERRPTASNVMKTVKHAIVTLQHRINTLESDRLDALSKLQYQDKEIKNLKNQLRRYAMQQKSLESDNNQKQQEIDGLLGEISVAKSSTSALRQESGKNISNLKRTLNSVTEEYHDNVEIRDSYLNSISAMIKDALKNSLVTLVDKNHPIENQGDSCHLILPENCALSADKVQTVIETSTQTPFVEKTLGKDNLQVTGNLSGTFHFHNDNHAETIDTAENIAEKRTRQYPESNGRKHDNQTNNALEDKKKSSLKRIVKKSESRPDESKPYVDSCKSWPALREVISAELMTLLSKYDIQRAQYRTVPNEKFNVSCQQLISELSAKENLIARLLSNQNSNSAKAQLPVESTSRCQQVNLNEQTAVDKSPNKSPAANPINVLFKNIADNKKKSKSATRTKVETVSTSLTNKRYMKNENQKPSPRTPRSSTSSSRAPTSKRATTTSTKSKKLTGSVPMSMSPVDAQKSDASTSRAQKPTATSPPSMQPVTSKSPETVDDDQAGNDPAGIDSRLFPLFVGTLLRLIHANYKLQSAEDLIFCYNLCYHRSVDCSQLISVNDDLETLINRSGPRMAIKKNRSLRIIVHVISACRYVSRRVLANKLIPQVDSADVDFKCFSQILSNENLDADYTIQSVDTVVQRFAEFCNSHSCQSVLIENQRRGHQTSTSYTSSSNVVFKKLKENISKLQTMCANHVTKVQYKSKQKLYHMNLKDIVMKIGEMGHIIDGQNTVIDRREEEILQLTEQLSRECNTNVKLKSVVNEIETVHQSQLLQIEESKVTVNKAKSYISGMIDLCELCTRQNIFNFQELLKDEESLYQTLQSCDSGDLIASVRDGIRAALKLSRSVKSIIL